MRTLSNEISYAEEWQKESESYESQGIYKLLSEITPHGRVLEVGVGSGAGTVALAQNHKVLGLENNTHLARIARGRIAEIEEYVNIIEDDVFNPSESTIAAISEFAPEVITAWFIGASGIEQYKNVSKEGSVNAQQWPVLYRQKIEDAILMPAICPPSVKWIHLVNRGSISASDSEDYFKAKHAEDYDEYVFNKSGFKVTDVHILPWDLTKSSFPYSFVDSPGSRIWIFASLLAKRDKK
ncbi:hypothetical protein NB722_000821 [Xanthomonas sacchari]|uniref:class I SAM-dependent methyltransferase n=1 Tax=Xanthomonas sacchari TaxID=56458 RepID=UPI00224DF9FE|nr:hypothetical protein [Xanthomonas sacchari]MCW0386282.1 hypothetical protein [Xanthomonas sacchari]